MFVWVIDSPPLEGRLRITLIRLSVCLSVCPVPVPFTESADTLLCRCAV